MKRTAFERRARTAAQVAASTNPTQPGAWRSMATATPTSRVPSTSVWEGEAIAVASEVLGSAAVHIPSKLPTHTDLPSRTESAPPSARAQVERLLGHDFSQVRVHTGKAAAAVTKRERAHAVTSGSDVYFGPGRYRPDLPIGRALIAHEFTHVAQQRAAPPKQPVTQHLRALRGGAAAPIAAYDSSAASFRAANDDATLAGQARAIEDIHPQASLTPAPGGMHQKWGDSPERTSEKAEQETPAPAPAPKPPSPKEDAAPQPPETPAERQRRVFGAGSATIDQLLEWIDGQITIYEAKIEAKRKKHKDKGWAAPTDAIQPYEERIRRLRTIRAELVAALAAVPADGANVLSLANVIWNEANAHPHAMQAVAYAWLNRTGGVVREPVRAEISHYQELSARWAAFPDDTARLVFVTSFIPALRTAIARLADQTPDVTDPTGGSKHWVSPIGLDVYDAGRHAATRYSRSVGKAKNRAFPNWAIANDDAKRIKKAKEGKDAIIKADYEELTVPGVPREDFLFYKGVK